MPLNYTDFNATTDFMNYTVNGRFLDAFFGTYYELIGGMFFIMLFAFTFFMLYIKTKSLGMVSSLMLILAVGMAMVMPSEMLTYIYTIIVLTLGALLASLFLERE